MLNQWPNLVLPGEPPDFLIVVAFVSEEYRDTARRARWIAFSVNRRICDFGRAFISSNYKPNI